MKLVIIRHGETEWTITGQYTGTTELTLTANGRHQATSLRPVLRGLLGDTTSHVFASPRVRAVETAHLVLPDAHVIVDPLLSEFDYGDYEGLTSAQVTNDRPGWSIWDDGCPGGETVSHVGARAIEFMTANVGSLNGATLVVVTHGHFSRILAATTVGLSGDQGRRFASATASVSVIEDHHGERCISLWNLTASTVSGHVTDRRHDAQH